jgi:hypothetical protein
MQLALVALALLVCSCASTAAPPAAPAPAVASAAAPAAANELAVPFGDAPSIDGKVGDAEWSRAAVVALDLGVTVRVLHDGARVYLAISGLTSPDELAFACVMIAEPGQVRVLHASAKLGTAIYTADAAGRFQPRSKSYEWRSADELMRDEGWMATTVSGDNRQAQELALTFAALGLPDSPRRIALGYFHVKPDATDPSQAGAVVWPRGLDDAVANVQLLGGYNPGDLMFEPARWIALRPMPR